MIFETIVMHPGMQYVHHALNVFFIFINTYIIASKTIVAISLQVLMNILFVILFPWRNESIDNGKRFIYFVLNFLLSILALSFFATHTGNPAAFHAYWFSINCSFILILQTVLNDQEITFF